MRKRSCPARVEEVEAVGFSVDREFLKLEGSRLVELESGLEGDVL